MKIPFVMKKKNRLWCVKINQSEKRKGAEIQTIWFTPPCVVDIDPVVEFGFGMTIVGNIPLFLSSFVSDANRMRDSEFFIFINKYLII